MQGAGRGTSFGWRQSYSACGWVPPRWQAQTIESVLVEGNERIEADTVRSYMAVGPGDAFDAEALNESLKSLFESGLFADVAIRREGKRPDR